ncbi:hypothetical protein Mal15_66560 [Stieleria maiorica]|uniref:Uncharacterized protein n=1 Tax=Stieleria maiorica TaxID=2795974 RepID=A0A5B9MRL5_9BACT|nr:hypothetical protein Mal15_66560 [Stieleria maiorica]
MGPEKWWAFDGGQLRSAAPAWDCGGNDLTGWEWRKTDHGWQSVPTDASERIRVRTISDIF